MFSSDETVLLTKICASLGVDLSQAMVERFNKYASLLLDWNKRIHLISKGDASSHRILRHIVDSLSIFKAIAIPNNANVLDLGAGAGFPSVPIKIVRNDIRLTLVESTHKKALFLHKLIGTLELDEVRVLDQRAEKLSEDADIAGSFDLVTAKAMGKLQDIAQLSFPLMKVGSQLVAYKGAGAKKEIAETKLPPQCRIKDAIKVEIAEMDLVRWLVVVHRVS